MKKRTSSFLTARTKPSSKNNSCGSVSKNGIRGRKEMGKRIGYFLTAPKEFLQ